MGWSTDSILPGTSNARTRVRWSRLGWIALVCAACWMPGGAASADEIAQRCVNATRPDALVTVAGRLTLQSFPGLPNYESVAQGDAEEQVFILELPRRICLEDGEFADGSERFDRVQVHAMEPALRGALQQAVAQDVTVAGRAVGAHTGHHHAPMVLFVGSVVVRDASAADAEDGLDRRMK